MTLAAELRRATSQHRAMHAPSFRFACALGGLALALAACTRTPDGVHSQPAASPSVPKIVQPLPRFSDLDKRETTVKNGAESTMGEAVAADLDEIGLPVYPTLKPADAYVIKRIDKKHFSMSLQGTVAAAPTTVQAWYVARLGSSFTTGRLHILGGEVGTFSYKHAGSTQSVLVQAERDEQTGQLVTNLTLTVTKPR